jgi:hypothetical protein
MGRDPFGWDYPAGAENDPNAPWNQTDEHHSECPAHEDARPKCAECGEDMDSGECWVFNFAPFFGRRGTPAIYCEFVVWLAGRSWTKGLFPGYCQAEEPECRCEELTDWEE